MLFLLAVAFCSPTKCACVLFLRVTVSFVFSCFALLRGGYREPRVHATIASGVLVLLLLWLCRASSKGMPLKREAEGLSRTKALVGRTRSRANRALVLTRNPKFPRNNGPWPSGFLGKLLTLLDTRQLFLKMVRQHRGRHKYFGGKCSYRGA